MLWLITIASFLASLAAKLLADHFLTERISLIGAFAGLQHAENKGVAFSITFVGPLQTFLIAAALILLFWGALRAVTRWSRRGFGLILGGALGNIADRLADGRVTDFFQVGSFPIFNVADSLITIGVAVLLIESFAQWKAKER